MICFSSSLVALGWSFILKGKRNAHQKSMVLAAALALIFLAVYIIRVIFFGNASFHGPQDVKTYYIAFLIFHIILAITGLVFGTTTITYAIKGRFYKHKRLGSITAVVWFISSATGTMVYLLLYIIWGDDSFL